VKNFQLICDSLTGEEVVLQFGRVAKHKFTLDVRYPLSPLQVLSLLLLFFADVARQAFGMCVACMDGKIADRKGYEFVRKITETFSTADAKEKKCESPPLSLSLSV
jgi:hypothetical protein